MVFANGFRKWFSQIVFANLTSEQLRKKIPATNRPKSKRQWSDQFQMVDFVSEKVADCNEKSTAQTPMHSSDIAATVNL